jgi:hypothetical protein
MEPGKYWEVPYRFDRTLHGVFLCLCADDSSHSRKIQKPTGAGNKKRLKNRNTIPLP